MSKNSLIISYVSRKSGIPKGIVTKYFGNVKSFDELYKAFIALVKSQRNRHGPGNVGDEGPAETLSYKTELLKSSGIPDLFSGIPETYIDHGCGSGKISKEIADLFGAKKRIGIDIYEHPDLTKNSFSYVAPELDGSLPLESESASIITCLLSIHHVSLQEKTVEELSRVLRSSGLLIVLDHDFRDNEMRLFLDAVHMTFSFFGTENENSDRKDTNVSLESLEWIRQTKYLPFEVLDKMIEESGLRRIFFKDLKNSQAMYLAVYTK